MSIEHAYKVELSWIEGRVGLLSSPELEDEIRVATPPEFPNGVEKIWSPEHLLTAAVTSCYMTTFLAVAENFHLSFLKLSAHAEGKLEMVDGRYLISEILLKPRLTIGAATDHDKAIKVLVKAESNCLISNSVKAKIVFEPVVLVDA